MTDQPGRRVTRGRAVVVVLVLGAIGFGLSVLPWATAAVPTVLTGHVVTVSGGEAAPVTTAASLAVLATALAVAIGGRWVTRVGAVALAALGILLSTSAVGFLLDPRPPLLGAAAQVSGVREIAGDPALTGWPYVTVGLGLAVVAAAVLTLRIPTTTAGRRFERGGASAGRGGEVRDQRGRAMDDWDALGRGDDPTATEHR